MRRAGSSDFPVWEKKTAAPSKSRSPAYSPMVCATADLPTPASPNNQSACCCRSLSSNQVVISLLRASRVPGGSGAAGGGRVSRVQHQIANVGAEDRGHLK